jgi:Zn-dependent protease with chaperone function
MILSYFAKLLCLAFSAFFLVHSGLCLALLLLQPAVLRWAEKMSSRSAARLLFAFRLLPLGMAVLVVLGLCVPSFLWFERFEPEQTAEQVGLLCIVTALLGAAVLAIALGRCVRALAGSRRYLRQFQVLVASEGHVDGGYSPLLVIEEASPLVMLAGVLRPRVVISRGVMRSLPQDQLDVAVGHERAHGISHDNGKRLLILLAPDVVPFWRGFSSLERTWARFAEWAADDQATNGDPGRSLSLAAALVGLARLGAGRPLPALIASLIPAEIPAERDRAGQELKARVERLLAPQATHEPLPSRLRPLLGTGTLVFAGMAAMAVLSLGGSQAAVHAVLEGLVR